MRTLTAFAVAAALAAPAVAARTSTPAAAAAPKPAASATPAAKSSTSAAPAASPAATPRKTTTTIEQLTKLLDEAGLDYHKEDDHLRVTFRWNDDRSQSVVLQPQPDIGEMPVVEIYSGVLEKVPTDPKDPQSFKIAQRLLRATGDQSMGYFGIEDVEGNPWVFCYHNLPTKGLTSANLAKVTRLVGELADEMEKELTAGKDEF